MPDLTLAAAALAGLTLYMYAQLTVLAVIAGAKGRMPTEYVKTKQGDPPPDWVVRSGRNFINLLELPLLFYVLAGFHLALPGTADTLQTGLGWGFVATRFAHTLVHVTINHVGLRFLFHRAGAVILIVMWIRFVLAAA
jgi:hypothetical protein